MNMSIKKGNGYINGDMAIHWNIMQCKKKTETPYVPNMVQSSLYIGDRRL